MDMKTNTKNTEPQRTQRDIHRKSLCALCGSVFSVFAFLGSSGSAYAQTQPSTQSSAPDLEVHEWVVMEGSPLAGKVNQDSLFVSTFPTLSDSRRTMAPPEKRDDPQPMGVIRVFGTSAAKVDVKLGFTKGRPLAGWPTAKFRSEKLLWDNLVLSAGLPTTDTMDGDTRPQAAEPGNWISTLRGGSAAYLRNSSGIERFLSYDAELEYPLPLKLTADGSAYHVSNTGSVSLNHLTLYKHKDTGWVGGEVPPSRRHRRPLRQPRCPPHSPPKRASLVIIQSMSPIGNRSSPRRDWTSRMCRQSFASLRPARWTTTT